GTRRSQYVGREMHKANPNTVVNKNRSNPKGIKNPISTSYYLHFIPNSYKKSKWPRLVRSRILVVFPESLQPLVNVERISTGIFHKRCVLIIRICECLFVIIYCVQRSIVYSAGHYR